MTPFYTRFPELADRETRCMHVLNYGDVLPVGEYGFIENYCADPGCDCRCVLLRVTSAQAPHTVLATINYGWESVEFYTDWMKGDAEAVRELREACLDPLNSQSRYANHLLDFFRAQMMTDPAYAARLARHYEMFKATQRPREEPTHPVPHAASVELATPPKTVPEILGQLRHLLDEAGVAPSEAALRAAIEQREAITPELIAAIDRVADDPWEDDEDMDDPLPDAILNSPPARHPHAFPPVPFVAPSKVGRNDPCPCGSRKKYKKCCGK